MSRAAATGAKVRLDYLRKKSDEIRREIQDIEDEELSVGAEAMIDKCFKARNSYSCPKKPSDYWLVYYRVRSSEGRWIYVDSFQVDKDGRAEFRVDEMRLHGLLESYTEIKPREYWSKFRSTMLKLAKDFK